MDQLTELGLNGRILLIFSQQHALRLNRAILFLNIVSWFRFDMVSLDLTKMARLSMTERLKWKLLANWFEFGEESSLPPQVTLNVEDFRRAIKDSTSFVDALKVLIHYCPQNEQQRVQLKLLISTHAMMSEKVDASSAIRVRSIDD